MSHDEDPPSELQIGAVAERSGQSVSALRFYEAQGLITAERTDGGQRRFHRDVLRRLAVIEAAQRVGFSLAEIHTMLDGLPEHVSAQEWQRLARSWRPAIDDRIRTLEQLKNELDSCIGCGCLSMKKCTLANPHDRLARRGPGPVAWRGSARTGTSTSA